ncbi:hypothetical protein ACOSP6_10945 [Tenacibaculum sp. MEBiC06402]|uniref:hypothetical protein n=1 Tax=unclassified Tenacibaculum TaxID=2635139 RepID=UPI003B9BDDD1
MKYKQDLIDILSELKEVNNKNDAQVLAASFICALESNGYFDTAFSLSKDFVDAKLQAFIYTLGIPLGNPNSFQLLELEQKLSL